MGRVKKKKKKSYKTRFQLFPMALCRVNYKKLIFYLLLLKLGKKSFFLFVLFSFQSCSGRSKERKRKKKTNFSKIIIINNSKKKCCPNQYFSGKILPFKGGIMWTRLRTFFVDLNGKCPLSVILSSSQVLRRFDRNAQSSSISVVEESKVKWF